MYWSGKDENKEFEAHLSEMIKKGGKLIDVGCGREHIDDSFIGVDAYEEGEGIVKAFMWDMPFKKGSIDGLTCMMALEHISKFQVIPTLTEFSRVLKSGGKAIIVVPDLLFCLHSFLENPNEGWEMDLIFGIQTRDYATIHEGEFHKTGFTRGIVRKYFDKVPGLNIEQIYTVNSYMQLNLGIIAVKE